MLLELRESLLSEVRFWIDDVQFEFAVVDPIYGTVEPKVGPMTERGWPRPLVRAVLDRVGVGLLEATDPR